MLQSVKEGIIAVDKEARVTLINNEAKRLFKKADLKKILSVKMLSCICQIHV